MSGQQLIAAQRIEVGPAGKVLAGLDQGGRVLVLGSSRSVSTVDLSLLASDVEVLPCAGPHNPVTSVGAAVDAARRLRPTTVLAVGGAGTIDLGKATVQAASAELVAVPTTLGGSEMSRVYGSRQPDGTKSGGSGSRLLPGLVCYDPALLNGLPGPILFASGVNALAHAIEAHYARRTHWVGTGAAVAAGSALPALLTEAVQRRDEAVHTALLAAACQAGFAMNACGMGLHHAVCHVLGGMTGIPHAALNVAVLPAAVTVNGARAAWAAETMLSAMGLSDIGGLIGRLAGAYRVPVSLGDLGVRPAQLDAAVPRILAAHHLANNPATVTEDDVARTLDLAFHGATR